MSKILFVLKKRTIYSENTYSTVNSGLYNSATFVNDMLVKNSIDSHLVEVNDNNEIDKYVTKYKPDFVIIEALWVVPSKFEVLQNLHPNVKWLIRLHSELPFIANEGIAMKWLREYSLYKNVQISSNSWPFIRSMEPILGQTILYLPNYYDLTIPEIKIPSDCREINVGLFGAVRPMKNSLTQAVAAIIHAEQNDKILKLHINTERVEQKGDNALKNMRELFEGTRHKLVEHKWYKHADFVKLVATMDIALQVSLTETYNIVAADCVNQLVPVVTSREIPFINYFNTCKENKDAQLIADKMALALRYKGIFTIINKLMLKWNSRKSERVWLYHFQ